MPATSTMPLATPRPASAVAYSYIRFSFAEQGRGDSVRRQTEAAQAWCDRNNARLDASTTLHDLGKSAFKGAHRQNPDRNALAAFLKLVEDGKVVRGSYLVIESLDRLTREHIRPALTLLLNLIEAGVRVVQLRPVEVVYDDNVEPMTLMMALMELSRGNSESKIKSQRIGAAHAAKRAKAREGRMLSTRTHTRSGMLITIALPAWVRVESMERDRYTLSLVPERAAVVAKIFDMAAGGLGLLRVVQKLTQDKIPAFGRVLSDASIGRLEDRRREAGKPPLTESERQALRRPGYWYRGEWCDPVWNRGYVHELLTDRRALGEYLPLGRGARGGSRPGVRPDGPPIKDYFPAVVDEATFMAARAAMSERLRCRGRRVGKHIDLFSRMIIDAIDGSTYYSTTRSEMSGGKKHTWRLLVNSSGAEGRSRTKSFPLPVFERAVLSMLREVDPNVVLGKASPGGDGVATLERQIGWLAQRQAELAAELRNGDVPVIARQLRELADEEAEAAARLDEARQLAAKPLSETWRDLGGLLDKAADPDARLRLRSAIARVVDSFLMIVVVKGRDRLAAVQANFAGGKGRRVFTIISRASQWVGNGSGGHLRPGRWWCGSVKHPDDGLPLNKEDLRDVDDVAAVRRSLEKYPRDLIDTLLAEDGQPLPSH